MNAQQFVGPLTFFGAMVSLYFIFQVVSIRVGVKGKHLAWFIEKNGFLVAETVKVNTLQSGEFFTASDKGMYKIDLNRSIRTDWPKNAPFFLRVPIMANIYVRSEPEPVSFGRDKIVSTVTAQMIANIADENTVKLLILRAEAQVGAKKANDFLTTLLIGITLLTVVGSAIFQFKASEKLTDSLQRMENALGIVVPTEK